MGWYDERFKENASRFKFACLGCGTGMWFPKCKVGKYKTCSAACAERISKEKKDERLRVCVTCGKKFFPRATQIKRGKGMFCSQACNTAARNAIHSDASKLRSQETRRQRFKSGAITGLRGENNPRWSGGKEAARQRRLAYVSQYKKENAEKVRVWNANRRNLARGKLPANIIHALKALQKNCCAVCRTYLDERFHLDHIIPLARGGKNDAANVQLLCVRCNLQKADKDPIDFMRQRGFLL